MKEINLTVIGSGSTYCPELIYGFIEAKDSLKLKRVAFMDIDERKRTIVGGLCVRMLKSAGIDCEVVMTDDLDLACRVRISLLHRFVSASFLVVILMSQFLLNTILSVRKQQVSAASSRLFVQSL